MSARAQAGRDDAVHGGPGAHGPAAHDFSTNANACGPCPGTVTALAAADPAHYPDPAYTALCARLAAFHGVATTRIVVAGSASEFIVRMTAAVAWQGAGAVEVPALAYGDYARAARGHGLAVQRPAVGPAVALAVEPGVESGVESGVGPDERPGAALGSALGVALRAGADAGEGEGEGEGQCAAPALVWACDPSSPLGQPQPGLAARIAALPPGVPLVLDRAYAPLRLQPQAQQPTPDALDRVWQLWSPNKALGLTGVRGAYAIAPVDDVQGWAPRLHRLAPSWPLGAHAVAMLEHWAGDAAQAWLQACLPQLRSWKTRQLALCASLGWQPLPSETPYFCARLPPGIDVAARLQALRAHGVQLRDCASFGLPGHVRLAVRPPASQDALAHAWRSTH